MSTVSLSQLMNAPLPPSMLLYCFVLLVVVAWCVCRSLDAFFAVLGLCVRDTLARLRLWSLRVFKARGA